MKSKPKKVEGTNQSNQNNSKKRILERTQKHEGLDISESDMSPEEFEQYFQRYKDQKF